MLPGTGFKGDGNDLVVARPARARAVPRRAGRFLRDAQNAIEPRGGMAYSINDKTVLRASAGVFHNRVTLNDSSLLGGNPPFQPQVSVSNGSVDNPGGGGAYQSAVLDDGAGRGLQAADGVHVVDRRPA